MTSPERRDAGSQSRIVQARTAGLTDLDQHQVRHWTSWYRWVTLAMLAAAV